MKKPVVLYDEKCGICKKEINFYKKVDKKSRIDWLDIHEIRHELNKYNLTFDEAMKSFHLFDENNKMYVGVDAFIQIYKYLPGWNLLANVISLPIIYHLAILGYKLFAFLRYRYHGYHKCEITY